MKRFFSVILSVSLFALPLFCGGCAKASPYEQRVSQLRTEIYRLEGESFSAICYEEEREYPFINDGKVGELKKFLIFNFTLVDGVTEDSYITVGDASARLTYRAEAASYVASVNAKGFNSNTDLLVFSVGEKREEALFERLTPDAIPFTKLLTSFCKAKKDFLNETGNYELRARISVRGEEGFWYVGVVTNEKTYGFLTDAQGVIIAEKTTLNL